MEFDKYDINQSKEELIRELMHLRKRNRELEKNKRRADFQTSVLESLNNGVCVLDQNGVIIYCNKALERMFGRDVQEIIGKSSEYFIKYHVLKESEDISSTNIKDGEIKEINCVAKNGRRVVVEVVKSILKGDNGAIKGYICLIKDITAKKQLEKEYRETLEQRELALLAGRLGMWDWDVLAGREYWNDEHFRIMGYDPGEVKPSIEAFLSKVYREDLYMVKKAIIRAIEEGRPVDVIFRMLKKDGTTRWVEMRGRNEVDKEGRLIRTYGISIDITERKRLSEETYRILFESIDEGLCIIDLIFDDKGKPIDFRFLEANETFEEHTGLKNVQGKRMYKIYPNTEKYWAETYGQVALTGETVRFVRESKILGRWLSVNAFKINTGTNHVGILIKDITKQKQSELEMEKAIKIQEEIFVNVSHELKTPLNVIFASNQMLEMYFKNNTFDENREKVLHNIRIIRQNCYRFTKLINNIVDLSRLDSGFNKMCLRNTNIVSVIDDIVQSVASYIKDAGFNIIFDTNEEVKIIAIDTNKIERIMLNLISNAIKFSKQGDDILVKVEDNGPYIEIIVIDQGVGIDQDHIESIFGRFNQVDKTLARNAEGTGIGLALVKSFVKLHGGRVSVDSNSGRGSTFKVEIPNRTIDETNIMEYLCFEDNRIDTLNIEFSDIYFFDKCPMRRQTVWHERDMHT